MRFIGWICRFILENTVLDQYVRCIVSIFPVVIWALAGVFAENYHAEDPSRTNIFIGEELHSSLFRVRRWLAWWNRTNALSSRQLRSWPWPASCLRLGSFWSSGEASRSHFTGTSNLSPCLRWRLQTVWIHFTSDISQELCLSTGLPLLKSKIRQNVCPTLDLNLFCTLCFHVLAT